MRPIRLLLSLSMSLVAGLFLFFVVLGSRPNEQLEQNSASGKQGGFKALFSFTAPGSLFPPSAIISLTDDNSTFFLARPAAFGPTLPADGLSSPLWIGSGFGDDAMGRGELGCGDTPDWEDHEVELSLTRKPSSSQEAEPRPHIASEDNDPTAAADASQSPDDSTDDHRRRVRASGAARVRPRKQGSGRSDIQTLQESAEIEGKVVLLKRGGCGFLAKVLWAQKRGAVAVIVGDDVRGGDLVRMYANGDTSNVTISSLFTSHTTAHLLSSLLPRDTAKGLPRIKPGAEAQQSDGAHISSKSQPVSTPHAPSLSPSSGTLKHEANPPSAKVVEHGDRWTGWLEAVASMSGYAREDEELMTAGSRRPPASGDLVGLESDDLDDDQKLVKGKAASVKPTTPVVLDDFTIGKQDWRDPDVLTSTSIALPLHTVASSAPVATKTSGGILPGSGEYPHRSVTTHSERQAWWARWYSPKAKDASIPATRPFRARSITSITGTNMRTVKTGSGDSAPHEGLWVTLTPTNVSTSPFFDTLLVLVVSPLVTLTVVYALLLLRSRIRRRRWRAPKSLVERLPVRTYQTMSDSACSASPPAASPTTPLLQHSSPQPTSPVQSLASEPEDDAPATTASVQENSRAREEEKRESGLAEWRRRYGGRQRECVVCLDEYVDGVSQVMSLPCGHEFHADCITPWLVTRRRTCPICKGDVVRSLAQAYTDRQPSPSPTPSAHGSNNADGIQAQAAEMRNDSPSSSLPMPISGSASASHSRRIEESDLEANWSSDESRQGSADASATNGVLGSSLRDLSSTVSTVIWRGVEAVRTSTGFQRRPPEDVDRNR